MQPSPSAGCTPAATAARQAGRQRRRSGPRSAGSAAGWGDQEGAVLGGGPTPCPTPTWPGRALHAALRGAVGPAGQEISRAVRLMVKCVPQSNFCKGTTAFGTARKLPLPQNPAGNPSEAPTVLVTPCSLSSLSPLPASRPCASSTVRASSRGVGGSGAVDDGAVGSSTASSSTASSSTAMGLRFQDKHRAGRHAREGIGLLLFFLESRSEEKLCGVCSHPPPWAAGEAVGIRRASLWGCTFCLVWGAESQKHRSWNGLLQNAGSLGQVAQESTQVGFERLQRR